MLKQKLEDIVNKLKEKKVWDKIVYYGKNFGRYLAKNICKNYAEIYECDLITKKYFH